MTSTERAALRLALGVLRKSALDSPQPGRDDDGDGVDGDVWSDAIEILTAGGHASFLVGFHAAAALKWVDDRELRARVCLLIRAVLRAERGDEFIDHAEPSERGGWSCYSAPADAADDTCNVCNGVGRVNDPDEWGAVCAWCGGVPTSHTVFRPLWLIEGGGRKA